MDENTILLTQKKKKSETNKISIDINKNDNYESINVDNDKNIIYLMNKKNNFISVYKYYRKIKWRYNLTYYGIGLITSILSLMITTLTALNKFDNKYNINNQINIDYLLFIISILISGFTLLLNFFKIETQINKLDNLCNNYKNLISEMSEIIIKYKMKKMTNNDIYNVEIMIINKLKLINTENLNLFCDICDKKKNDSYDIIF